MTTYFVDTSAWVALFDRADKYHPVAAQAFRSHQAGQLRLITTDYVLDETLTLLRYRCNHQVAVAFGKWVQTTPVVDITPIDSALWSAAWTLFQQYADKSWAFTDCTSFTLMRELDLVTALAFDHHFEQAGFLLWPQQ